MKVTRSSVLTLIVLLVVLFCSTPIRAQEHPFFEGSKSSELIGMLLAPENPTTGQMFKKLFALGYIRGIADTMKVLETAKFPTSITNDELGDAVLVYAAKHVDSVDQMPACALVVIALNAKYGVENTKPAPVVHRTPKIPRVNQIPKSEIH